MSVSYGPNLHKMINALTGDSFAADFRVFLQMIDALVQSAVISRTLSTPPGAPNNGDRYIIGPAPTGAWAGAAGQIAHWTMDDPAFPAGVWREYAPNAGFLVFSVADAQFLQWSGSAWIPATTGALPVYTVANLPTGAAGMVAYASNGRKTGEGAGAGTGVPVYFSNAAWRVYSTDAAVAA
jgi:hypothetical protein